MKEVGNTFFQTRVRDLRTAKGVTMEELAGAIGVTKSRVNMWENNGTIPREEALIGLSRYFKVSTDYLLGNDEMIDVVPEKPKLKFLQRNLSKLDDQKLEMATEMLKAVFKDLFDEDETAKSKSH